MFLHDFIVHFILIQTYLHLYKMNNYSYLKYSLSVSVFFTCFLTEKPDKMETEKSASIQSCSGNFILFLNAL